MPAAQGYVITAFSALSAHRCVVQTRVLFQSVRCWQGQLKFLQKRPTSNIDKNGLFGVLKRMYQTVSFLPLN